MGLLCQTKRATKHKGVTLVKDARAQEGVVSNMLCCLAALWVKGILAEVYCLIES
jgi:hypothetical protein